MGVWALRSRALVLESMVAVDWLLARFAAVVKYWSGLLSTTAAFRNAQIKESIDWNIYINVREQKEFANI